MHAAYLITPEIGHVEAAKSHIADVQPMCRLQQPIRRLQQAPISVEKSPIEAVTVHVEAVTSHSDLILDVKAITLFTYDE